MDSPLHATETYRLSLDRIAQAMTVIDPVFLDSPQFRPESLERLTALYLERFPDGRERQSWPGLIYLRARPTWLRYSDFSHDPPEIVELDAMQLRVMS